MSKPLIVIADMDENYLSILEKNFLKELGDRADLEIISDTSYFIEFFSTPITAEIVIVDEKMYTKDLQKHNITNLFVLSESKEVGITEELSVNRIFKYLGIRELYNELTYRSEEILSFGENYSNTTQVIALYSAIGGTGKTSLSVGLAKCLVAKHKRILYINTESFQAFSIYLNDKNGMPNDGYRAIKADANNIFHNVKKFIRKEDFEYLPPFSYTLDACNLNFDIYEKLIVGAKESGNYDFIVVDVETGYSHMRTRLIELADRVMLITLQDKISVYKMEYMMSNLDFRDNEKYMVICNKYDDTKENYYIKSELQNHFPIKEYIDLVEYSLESAEQLAHLDGIEKLSYMYI